MDDDEVMDYDSGELTFTAIEIDLDYDFDAARFFDFTRDETPLESLQSELWFESACSYPPSPFVTELIMRENTFHQQLCTSPRSSGEENMSLEGSDSDNEQDCSRVNMNNQGRIDCTIMKGEILNNLQSGGMLRHLPTGLTFPNQLKKDDSKAQAKSFAKPSFPRVSTLMKPTASQLAKQNRQHQIGDPRFSKLVNSDKPKCGNTPFGTEMQAAKRQKLEGGILLKDGGTKQQNVLIHKVSKKEETINGNSKQAKFKITIPREPELVTSQRAYRMRPKDNQQSESAAPDIRRFKARPLNKKILDAPSLLLPKRSTPRLPEFQEFHLKTKERASQHSLASSSSLVHEGSSHKMLNRPMVHSVAERTSRESRRPSAMDVSRHEGNDTIHSFKARPLNKKIFSSKGDIGVFRNVKKDVTVPMEFNFQTEKRIQRNIQVDDLFNKLSLNELQPKTRSQLPLPRSSCLSSKDAKENRSVAFRQEHEIKHSVKEYIESGHGRTHHTINREIANVELFPGMSRGLGIR